jgi:hypothetical protein
MTQHEDRQTLEGALAYLRKHGWVKRTALETGTGRVCAIGAVYCSLTPNGYVYPEHLPTIDRVADQLRDKVAEITGTYISVESYNDDPKTTYEDIETLFEKTIADL